MHLKCLYLRPAWAAALCALALAFAVHARAAEDERPGAAGLRTVRLQLKWLHQFQFAGYYAARARGFYEEAGLDVKIMEARTDQDPVAPVVEGRAEFGIGNSALLAERARGHPVVALAVTMQHSPYVVLARSDAGIRSVHDLPGNTLMLEPHAEELLAYLGLEKVPLSQIRTVAHAGSVEPLVAGTVDAMTAYITTEPYYLQKRGVEYVVLNPRASGIDFYGDTLYTTEAVLEADEEMVRAFREASLRGWEWALAHVDETIDLILREYAPHLERAALEFEAHEIEHLMLTDMVEPGYMYEGRWRHIAGGFEAAGLLEDEVDLDEFLYLPGAGNSNEVRRLYWSLGGGAAVLVVVTAVLFRFHGLNLRLREEIAERRGLEERLRVLADTDPLTGVMNRRRFLQRAAHEMARFRRSGRSPSLLVMDVDHFKQVNDEHGHATGDEVLKLVTGTCENVIREIDTLARMGGEEFAVLLPETGLADAMEVAGRIRTVMERVHAHDSAGNPVGVTISVGVTEVRESDRDVDAPLARADRALYRAKEAGRNRVMAGEEQASTQPA